MRGGGGYAKSPGPELSSVSPPLPSDGDDDGRDLVGIVRRTVVSGIWDRSPRFPWADPLHPLESSSDVFQTPERDQQFFSGPR